MSSVSLVIVLFAATSIAAATPATNPATTPANPPAPDLVYTKRVLVVCNGSASMAKKFPAVKAILGPAVSRLTPSQQFNLIFVRDGQAIPFNKDGAVLGTKDNRAKLTSFMEKFEPKGSNDPSEGLSLAFQQHPTILYLLTDTSFAGNDAVLKQLRDLNKPVAEKVPVKVSLVVFIEEKEPSAKVRDLLELIAKENDGVFRLVNINEPPSR
jgi:hypothetical protein